MGRRRRGEASLENIELGYHPVGLNTKGATNNLPGVVARFSLETNNLPGTHRPDICETSGQDSKRL